MIKLEYTTVEHMPFAEYGGKDGEKYRIDWKRNEEKYKVMMPHVHVYQGGRVEVLTSTWRDPYLRRVLKEKCGLEIMLLKDMRMKLKTPDGKPVTKTMFRYAPMFLIDHEYKRALTGNNFAYVAHGYPPESNADVDVFTRNKVREATFMQMWGDTIKLATTVAALGNGVDYGDWYARRWLENPVLLDAGEEDDLVYFRSLAGMSREVMEKLVALNCHDKAQYKYLTFD